MMQNEESNYNAACPLRTVKQLQTCIWPFWDLQSQMASAGPWLIHGNLTEQDCGSEVQVQKMWITADEWSVPVALDLCVAFQDLFSQLGHAYSGTLISKVVIPYCYPLHFLRY